VVGCLFDWQVRLMNEQFIELFDIDLISIPEHHAPWLVRM